MRQIKEKQLNKAFREGITRLGEKFESMPWEEPEFYAHWLAQTYYLVVHTTRFLGLCASKLGPDMDKDHQHTLEHIVLERGHDQLALSDIRAMGRKLESLPELHETASLYHSQYFWIERVGPMAHFGYSLCLEGLAAHVGMRVTERLAAAHGDKAVRFIRLHSIEDVDHFESGVASLDDIDPKNRDAVIKNLEHSCYMYSNMLDRIAEAALPAKKPFKRTA
jgi:hypothetical protein